MLLRSSPKLIALPVQLIETNGGVLLRRGALALTLSGEGIREAVELIFSLTQDGGLTVDELCEKFADEDRKTVEQLISQLTRRRLLLPETGSTRKDGNETSEDVFYWQFGTSESEVLDRLRTKRLGIAGVNRITCRLVAALKESGFDDIPVFDHPELRNRWLFHADGTLEAARWSDHRCLPTAWTDDLDLSPLDCLIATSDFGSNATLLDLNERCLARAIPFLPVTLSNLTGYVGPLVLPRETPCLQCLYTRQDSNFTDPPIQRALEDASAEGQEVIGCHPAMTAILGDVAAFELTSFFGKAMPFRPDMLTRINVLKGAMQKIRVLKVPRCPACSPLIRTPAISITKINKSKDRFTE